MTFPRSSGILLHPTSLPGPYGIGELGPEAHDFADFLRDAGQRIWQVLPLGPTGYGDSPYQCFSAFAGNPLLISIDRLVERGYLDARDLAGQAGVSRSTTWTSARSSPGSCRCCAKRLQAFRAAPTAIAKSSKHSASDILHGSMSSLCSWR